MKHLSIHGFTLVELLVVIAVIGILTTFGIATYSSTQAKARDAKRKADIRAIQGALQLYFNDHGAYPNTGAYCCAGWRSSTDAQPWIPGLDSNYIKQLPVDPKNTCCGPWNTGTYQYAYSSNGPHYNLVAQLENKGDPDRCELKQWIWITSNAGTGPVWCAMPIPGYSIYMYAGVEP